MVANEATCLPIQREGGGKRGSPRANKIIQLEGHELLYFPPFTDSRPDPEAEMEQDSQGTAANDAVQGASRVLRK